MNKTIFGVIATALVLPCAFAVDGVVLINQSTVVAAGGFPYKITQPGSYRLTGNLTVPDANTTAIVVNANNVTIDLNGFSILGPTICSSTFPVRCSPTGTGNGIDGGNDLAIGSTTVVNGSVHGMGRAGILLFGPGSLVEKVHADNNGFIGIEVQTGIVKNNTASLNGFHGIFGFVNTVSGNMLFLNGGSGIHVGCPSSIVGNTSVDNNLTNIVTDGVGCAVANNAAP